MKLTKASYLAILAVVRIAKLHRQVKRREDRMPIASHDIAQYYHLEKKGEGKRFLLKVLKPLVQYQILRSVKGPRGGYSLAKAPSDITLLDIIEAADHGPIRGSVPQEPSNVEKAVSRYVEMLCLQAADLTRDHLANVRVSDLLTLRD